jgi:hypothetical protein
MQTSALEITIYSYLRLARLYYEETPRAACREQSSLRMRRAIQRLPTVVHELETSPPKNIV